MRAIATHFRSEAVVIVGSQAILASLPNAPRVLAQSPEIDAYPDNAAEWQALNPGEEASEEIHALFGEGSDFHLTHGFYIDGVDETTAKLPPDWRSRQVIYPVPCGQRIACAVAPEVSDLVISKLCRLDLKDQEFVQELNNYHELDVDLISQRIQLVDVDDAVKIRAVKFIQSIGRQSQVT